MSGHSKWRATFKGVKCVQDAKRGENFSKKVSREIYMAAKAGGPDPRNESLLLRLAVDKAKSAIMPNDNIARAIKSQ